MKNYFIALAACSMVLLAACSNDTSGPTRNVADTNVLDLVPDYAVSAAAVIDGAGIGASLFPDSLQLTADQKGVIQGLHDAFAQAHGADVSALRNLEKQIRDLRKLGAAQEQVLALLTQAHGIQQKLADAFAALQDAIWQVYTPAQRAWIEAHRPKVCDRSGAPALTDAQVTQIRALRDAFQITVAADLAFIKHVHEEAQAARQEGKAKTEIDAILATARDALTRVRAAEIKLNQDILAVLTPEQRAHWCVIRQQVAPRRR
jgi:Spy/CpxP family protein refolding chaperone